MVESRRHRYRQCRFLAIMTKKKRNTQVHNAWRHQLTYPSTEFYDSILYWRKMFPTSNRIRERVLKTVKRTEWCFNFEIMEMTTRRNVHIGICATHLNNIVSYHINPRCLRAKSDLLYTIFLMFVSIINKQIVYWK